MNAISSLGLRAKEAVIPLLGGKTLDIASEEDADRPLHRQSSAIDVRDLSVGYHGQWVVRELSLAIPKNQITAIMGPSGCGKSSFLATLNRMSDLSAPCCVSGQVWIEGRNIFDDSTDVRWLRRHTGMIFQRPNPFPLSIRDNIALPLKDRGIGNRADRQDRVIQALQAAGLWEEVKGRLDESALSLSGGQQQRLCIARALAMEPKVLLMDEPCSSLDPIATRVIEDLIVKLADDRTIVVVTHNLAQARRISDHTALFWYQDGSGRLIEAGPTKQMFEEPKESLTQAYIEGRSG